MMTTENEMSDEGPALPIATSSAESTYNIEDCNADVTSDNDHESSDSDSDGKLSAVVQLYMYYYVPSFFRY